MDGETDGTVLTENRFNYSDLNFLNLDIHHTIFILYVLLILFTPVD